MVGLKSQDHGHSRGAPSYPQECGATLATLLVRPPGRFVSDADDQQLGSPPGHPLRVANRVEGERVPPRRAARPGGRISRAPGQPPAMFRVTSRASARRRGSRRPARKSAPRGPREQQITGAVAERRSVPGLPGPVAGRPPSPPAASRRGPGSGSSDAAPARRSALYHLRVRRAAADSFWRASPGRSFPGGDCLGACPGGYAGLVARHPRKRSRRKVTVIGAKLCRSLLIKLRGVQIGGRPASRSHRMVRRAPGDGVLGA